MLAPSTQQEASLHNIRLPGVLQLASFNTGDKESKKQGGPPRVGREEGYGLLVPWYRARDFQGFWPKIQSQKREKKSRNVILLSCSSFPLVQRILGRQTLFYQLCARDGRERCESVQISRRDPADHRRGIHPPSCELVTRSEEKHKSKVNAVGNEIIEERHVEKLVCTESEKNECWKNAV
uniref:Uncharacterized protein n=1 Tax=Timema douglasi TaxID=61478 RepID=A0A7R8VJX0_TIMDO|nr:unnamed protein product [Timema douglasi]